MSKELLIRPFTQTDTANVIALWDTVFPDEPPWNEATGLITTKLTVQPELFFVCIRRDMLVGTVIAGFDGVRGWVHKVACAPQARRQGVAAALMAAAEQGLAQLGCAKLNIQVRADNHAALDFYAAAGYQVEDRVSLSKRLGADVANNR